ncbi:SMI1/KNR4 family protein [Streptomyces sp. NPDC096030]|uniref:SMI1/KNR4 family protein n=1 Tax=Streptomyces sp. NPDC096030 TaxID=3155423 RepID=UPI003327FDD2
MDHLGAVFTLMGEPRRKHEASAAAWERVEANFDAPVPDDYKKIVQAYAPVQVNWHLYFLHPEEDLEIWMGQTIEAFRGTSWDEDVICPGFEDSGPLFGGRAGMVPLATTDRGEYVFAAREEKAAAWRILTCDGEEQDFYEYRMGFAEWLHGWLSGGDMFGPDSSVYYPGPVRLERPPKGPGEPSLVWEGPER